MRKTLGNAAGASDLICLRGFTAFCCLCDSTAEDHGPEKNQMLEVSVFMIHLKMMLMDSQDMEVIVV